MNPVHPDYGRHTGPPLSYTIPGTYPASGPPSPPREVYEAIDIKTKRTKSWFDSFAPHYVWPAGGSYTVRLQPGHVEEIVPQSGIDCVVVHPVKYNGAVHTSEVEIDVPFGSVLVVKVNQDDTGLVQTDFVVPLGTLAPELLVVPSVPVSDHWYPEDPDDSGDGGTLYFPLYQIDRVDGVPEITLYHWGPVVIRNDLWIGKNTGYGARVFKEHSETEGAVYKFRSLVAGTGMTITERSDDILFEADGGFTGDSVGDGEPVYLEPGHVDKANPNVEEFRSISGGESPRNEIDVSRKDAGTIQVRGNSHIGTLRFEACEGGTELFTLTWNDGLVTVTGGATIGIPGCPATTSV